MRRFRITFVFTDRVQQRHVEHACARTYAGLLRQVEIFLRKAHATEAVSPLDAASVLFVLIEMWKSKGFGSASCEDALRAGSLTVRRLAPYEPDLEASQR